MAFRIAAIDGMGAITETSPGVFVTTGVRDYGLMQAASSLLRGGGVDDISSDGLKVTATAPASDDLTVVKGGAWVENSAYTPGGSEPKFWYVYNDSDEIVTIPANGAGNPRIDLVCVAVNDSQTPGADGAANCTYTVITGTAAASPTAPSVPVKSTVVAQVAVANGFSTITNANITDRRIEPYLLGRKAILNNNEFFKGADPSGTLTSIIGISGSSVIVGDGLKDNNIDEIIGKTTLTAAGDTMTLSALPVRAFLRIVILTIPSASTTAPAIRFNNDSGNNYSVRSSTDGAADGTGITQSSIAPVASIVQFPYFVEANMLNYAGHVKVGRVETVQVSANPTATEAPRRVEGGFKWFNVASPVTRVDVVNLGAGDFASGSKVIVYGHD